MAWSLHQPSGMCFVAYSVGMELFDWGGSGRLHAPSITKVRYRPARHESCGNLELLMTFSYSIFINWVYQPNTSFPINSNTFGVLLGVRFPSPWRHILNFSIRCWANTENLSKVDKEFYSSEDGGVPSRSACCSIQKQFVYLHLFGISCSANAV